MMAVTVMKIIVVMVMQRAIVSDLRMLILVEFVPFHGIFKSPKLRNSSYLLINSLVSQKKKTNMENSKVCYAVVL